MVTPGRAARRIGIAVAVFAVVIATAHSPHVMAQGIDPAAPARQAPAQEQAPRFPRVVEALRRAPGCLGVETGQTASGKLVIFAWFEGKKALVDWYHSDAHRAAMKAVFPAQTFDRTPLPDLAEDIGPVLAIVSVKFADPPRPEASPSISSIGIELYGPLPGGVAVGGRFAPAALTVRGLREIEIAPERPR